MLAFNRDELICDLAQYYQIFDHRAFPGRYIATLTAGLGAESRVRSAASGSAYALNTLLLARISDDLAFLAWSRTKAAAANQGRPASMLEAMLRPAPQRPRNQSFSSPEAFEKARAKILERGRKI